MKLLKEQIFLLLLIFLIYLNTCLAQESQIKSLPENYLDYDKLFKNNLDSTKIFGLGEFTHGGTEPFEVKSSIIKYLISKKDFKILFLELDDPALRQIDSFLLDNKSYNQIFLDTIFRKAFSETLLNCQEIKDLIIWIKKYNMDNPANKVKLKGIDLCDNFVYFKENYFSKNEYLKIKNDNPKKKTINLNEQYEIIKRWFNENELVLRERFSEDKYNQLLQDINNYEANVNSEKDGGSRNRSMVQLRDSVMALNVIREASQKSIIWAHNAHVASTGLSLNLFFARNLGYYLKNKYESAYSCLLTEFSESAIINAQPKNKFKIKKKNPHNHAIGYLMRNQIDDIGFFDVKDITLPRLITNIGLEGRRLISTINSKSFDFIIIFKRVTPSKRLE